MYRPFELTDSAKLLHFTILGGSADPPCPPPKWRHWREASVRRATLSSRRRRRRRRTPVCHGHRGRRPDRGAGVYEPRFRGGGQQQVRRHGCPVSRRRHSRRTAGSRPRSAVLKAPKDSRLQRRKSAATTNNRKHVRFYIFERYASITDGKRNEQTPHCTVIVARQ